MKALICLALFAISTPAMAQQADAHVHHAEMDHSAHAQKTDPAPNGCTEEHAAMGHCTMTAKKADANADCAECCEGTDCMKDCCKDGVCDMECCEDGTAQCEGEKDCCVKADAHQKH